MKIKISFLIFILFCSNLYASIVLFGWNFDGPTEKGFRDGILSVFPNTRFYTFGSAENKELLKLQVKAAKNLNANLYFTTGLEAVNILLNQNKNTPIVFVMFKDPVKNAIIASRKQPGGIATGITTKIPIQQQLNTLKKIKNFKKIGIIKIEKNKSYDYSKKELKRLEKFINYKLMEINFDNMEQLYFDIKKKKPDAIYLPQIKNIDIGIIKLINKLKIPTISADSNLVPKGVMLSLVIDKYRAGQFASKQAIKILKGKSPAKIPVLPIEHFMVAVNLKTAQEINVNIPLSILIIADQIIR